MGTKIKICGLTRQEDIAYVNEIRPDYIGFVFFSRSFRYVTVETAKKLRDMLSPEILSVGVFLDNPLEEILEVADSGAVQVLQLHGRTAPELVGKLKEITTLPVWEAIQVNSEADVDRARTSPADMVLLDHGPGGTGERFDWSYLHGMERPFFLAGGLNASNIKEALNYHPYGVDTSSGVETNKKKDRDKIREFVRLVRSEEEEKEYV